MAASFEFVKQVTEIGLTFMTPKARRDRLEEVIRTTDENEETIDCSILANLINECRAAAGTYLEQNEERISTDEADTIRSMLKLVDGKKAVETADPKALAEWVRELKLTGCGDVHF